MRWMDGAGVLLVTSMAATPAPAAPAAVGPPPIEKPAAAYDRARQRLVLFGGRDARPALRPETWEWDGRSWTRVAAGTALPRSFHSAAYDVRRARNGGDTWTPVAEGGPGPRDHHAMAYDVARDRLVVYGGGAQPFDGTFLADTWEFDGQAWHRADAAGPGPRGGMPVMAYDARHAVVLLFGGTGPEGLVSDLWAWDGRAWLCLWSATRS